MTMAQLAAAMTPSVNPQSIRKFSSGKEYPSLSELVAIGKALNVSLDFLLGGQIASLKCPRWSNQVSARDIARVESLIIEKIENYLTIESILELSPISDPFRGLRIRRVPDEDAQLEKLAHKVRVKWYVGGGPIPSVIGLLERMGLMIIEADIPEPVDRLTCQAKCINGRSVEADIVSYRTSAERTRFNLARELARRVIALDSIEDKRVKEAMSSFAGAFLVPRAHLLKQTGRNRTGMTAREVLLLAQIYGIPAIAMLMRLGETGVLSKSAVERAFRGFASSWRKHEPEPIDPNEGFASLETPRRYESLVWRALGEWLISPVRGAKLLNLSLDEVERGIRGNQAPRLASQPSTTLA